MWRLTLSSALAHRSRLLLTWLAVTLAVAFVTGSLVLTDTSSRVLDDQFRTTAAGVDLTVRSAAAFEAAMGVEVQRDPLPAGLADRVAATPGVGRVQVVASGPAHVRAHGTAAGSALVASWAAGPSTAYHLRTGHAPRAADEVVVDAATARLDHLALGDTLQVAATASRTLRVVGTIGVGDRDGLAGSTVVLTDLPTAQALLGLGSRVSAVDVIAAEATPVPQLRNRLAAALGGRYAVTSSEDAAAAGADAARQGIGYLRIVLLALAAAGLVVGAFLITNTFGIVLAQRVRELALLRAVGATGRQVLASVLGEALLVGLTGAVSGVVAGVGASYGLRGLAQRAGLALPGGALTLTGPTLGIALAAGTLVTVLAALGPARRAARISPVEALRGGATGTRRVRVIGGWGLLALGVAVLVAAALSGTVGGVGVGAALLLAALIVLGPVLMPPLARTIGHPMTALGVPGQLARESTARNPRRTSATAAALALSLALISFVAVLGSSVNATTAAGAEAITADLLVQSSGQEMLGGLSPEVAGRIARLPQVAAVSPTRVGHWLDHGTTGALTAVDPATLPQVARVRMTAGSLSALDDGGVVVSQTEATARGLRLGDTVAMTFPRDGTQRLRVVGVMTDPTAQALATAYVLSLASYARHYSEHVDATVYVALADGVGEGPARAALRDAVAGFPNAQIQDHAQAAASRADAIDQVLGLITLLLGLAVLIALLGITNTLALSIVERTREIGLLRAVGMARAQLRRMIRAEAVLIAAVAVAGGLVLGLGLSVATLSALASADSVVIQVPWGRLVVLLVLAVGAGLAAGLLPARRAARLDVLTAIAHR